MPWRESRFALLLMSSLLIALASAIYLPTLSHDFVDYDDNQYITENEITQQGLTWKGTAWAFTTFKASNWHPLAWLSHMMDVQVWGLRSGGHHLTNVILHALNTLLLFLLLHRTTSAVWRSALVAAVFAVHPLHVESVAWISERKDVLSTFFGLLAMWWYVGWVKSPAIGRYVMIMLWFALSLMAKPMLVTLPCVLMLMDVWPLGRLKLDSSSWTRLTLEKLPLFALSAASCAMTLVSQGSGKAIHTLEMLPLHIRAFNAATSYGAYLVATVWPVDLAVIYPLSGSPSMVAALASIGVLAVITVLAVVLRRKYSHLLVGWLWFLGTLIPVIGLVQVGMQARADRYMYVPMIGVLVMAAWSAPAVNRMGRSIASIAGVAIVVALAIVSFVQTACWKDTETLFTHVIAVTNDNFVAHNALGGSLRKRGETDKAVLHLTRALDIRSDYPAAHNNLGLLYMTTKDWPKAREHFEASLTLQPKSGEMWTNLGVVAAEQGLLDEAVQHYARAIELTPQHIQAHINLGNARVKQGRNAEAITRYQAAVDLNENSAEAHAGLGAALWNERRVDEAVRHLSRAVELNGELIDARITLGVALASQGRIDDAIQQFEAALRHDPNHSAAKQYLEAAHQQRHQSGP